MNCQQIQQWLAKQDVSELPADVQQHLDQCPECRKAHERTQNLLQLIRLKRYENPPSGLADQCAVDVIRRLKQGEEEPESLLERWREFISWPQAQVGLAVAAVVLLLLAASLLWITGKPDERPAQSLADTSTNLTTDQELPANQMLGRLSITNVDPAKIEYGTQPSRVVDFEK
jgi:hypothetical protein